MTDRNDLEGCDGPQSAERACVKRPTPDPRSGSGRPLNVLPFQTATLGEPALPLPESAYAPGAKPLGCVDCRRPLVTVAGGLRECVNPECDMSIVRKAAR